jgi:hypothetical protein
VRKDPLDFKQAFRMRTWEGAILGVTQCTLWSHMRGRVENSIYVYLRSRDRKAGARAVS